MTDNENGVYTYNITLFSLKMKEILLFTIIQIGLGSSLMTQMVRNLPAMKETRVPSLSQEDPLEKGMATHSSILAWRILWTEGPGRVRLD